MRLKANLVLQRQLDGETRETMWRLFNRFFVDVTPLVGRLCAGQLVGHSLVLATAVAAPHAAAQPSAGAANVRGTHATRGSNKVDVVMRQVFANRDVDDIQNVTANFSIPDEVMQEVMG